MANKILPVADALKQLYTSLGGEDPAVLGMSTNTELIQEIAEVAGGGGGYDIIISTTEFSNDLTDYTFEKFDMDSLVQKLRNGGLITGVVNCHYNYDEDVEGDTNSFLMPLMAVAIYSESGDIRFQKLTNTTISSAIHLRSASLDFHLTYDENQGYVVDSVQYETYQD